MNFLRSSARSPPQIFDKLNAYNPEEHKKLNIQTLPPAINSSNFGSTSKKSPKTTQDIDSKHFDFLKAQNQEIYSSKNRCAILESDISKMKKLHSAEISEYKEKITIFEKKLTLSNHENDRLCNTLITLNSELDHWKKEYSILESKSLQISLENEKMIRSNKLAAEEIANWREKNSLGENNIMAIYKEMENMQAAIESHNQIVNGFQKEIEILTENNLKLESLCKKLRKENESLKEKNLKLDHLFQASSDDLDELKADYNKLMNNNEKKLEDIKEEGSKVIVEVNLKYQDLFNKKNMLDEQYKQLLQKNREINQRLLANEAALQEKNHKIIELEMKLNSDGGELENLIKELAVKDQTIYRLKTEKIKPVSKLENKLFGQSQQIHKIHNNENKISELEESLSRMKEEIEGKKGLEEKVSHLIQTLLLCCAENDRLHNLIKTYKS